MDKHPGVFTNSHTIYNRNRLHANKGSESSVENRSINIKPIWVWPVQQNEPLLIVNRSFQILLQRRNIGIEANSHILYVEDHDIDILQVFGAGFGFASIERDDRNAGFCINLAGNILASVASSAKPMFWRKNFFNGYAKS